MGQEIKKIQDEKAMKERQRQQEDTHSVFEIRKLFKFDNEFSEFVKEKGVQRPVSAYTSGLMEQISEKFNKIVDQVNQNTKNLKTKLKEEDLKLQKELMINQSQSVSHTP